MMASPWGNSESMMGFRPPRQPGPNRPPVSTRFPGGGWTGQVQQPPQQTPAGRPPRFGGGSYIPGGQAQPPSQPPVEHPPMPRAQMPEPGMARAMRQGYYARQLAMMQPPQY